MIISTILYGAVTAVALAGGAAVLFLRKEQASEEPEALPKPAPTRSSGRAVLRCDAAASALRRFDYNGIHTCADAGFLWNGPTVCENACLGYGDCVRACGHNAIELVRGHVRIHTERCDGCGDCVGACPRGDIVLLPPGAPVMTACASPKKGVDIQEACPQGCTGCGVCAQACSAGAIRIEDGLARIDYLRCTGCGDCMRICPRHALRTPVWTLPKESEKAGQPRQTPAYSAADDTFDTEDLRRIAKRKMRGKRVSRSVPEEIDDKMDNGGKS